MAKLPTKKRLREICDKLWSAAVKADWNYKCAICGKREDLNSHHLIPRQHYAVRYTLENGICLCAGHHQFCPHKSPHNNGPGFHRWLEVAHPIRAKWLKDTIDNGYEFQGTKSAHYFLEVMEELRQYLEPFEFDAIVGVRLAAYLERVKA